MPHLKDWMAKTVGISIDHKSPAQVDRLFLKLYTSVVGSKLRS